MKNFLRATMALATAMLMAISPLSAKLETNSEAINFELEDLFGTTYQLNEFTGSVIVLEFTNYNCPFVKKFYESGKLPNMQKEYRRKGVVWVQVSSSAPGTGGYMTPDDWDTLNDQWHVKANVSLMDYAGGIGKAYHVKVTPTFIVINDNFEVIYQGALDDMASPDSNDVNKGYNYLRDAIDAALKEENPKTDYTPAYGCSVKYNEMER